MRKYKKPQLHLDNFEEYKTSILKCLEWKLLQHFEDLSFVDFDDIKEKLSQINEYENINHIEPISENKLRILDDEDIDILAAEKSILDGKFFWEHAAAGEASRLGLGTKYLLNLKSFTIEDVVSQIRDEAIKEVKKVPLSDIELINKINEINDRFTKEHILELMGVEPDKLYNLSLGNRHMFQMVFDVAKLAKKYNMNPREVIFKQRTLVILNQATVDGIIEEFANNNFFGLNPDNVFFMVQRPFHGIYLKDDTLFFDKTTEKNKRLHNHGQMLMQKIHDDNIFRVNLKNTKERKYLKSFEFENILSEHEDLLSYNIEDLEYLDGAIDFASLALALELAKEDYNMVMEIVANNPTKPQKGGACFYDSKLDKVIMIESNQLNNIKNEEIIHLNKNFNHYPNPGVIFKEIRNKGLPIMFDVKLMFDQKGEPREYIYPCPVQGDSNFLVNTAFVMRKNLKPISNWKSPATTPAAVSAMYKQDSQEGFIDLVESILRDEE